MIKQLVIYLPHIISSHRAPTRCVWVFLKFRNDMLNRQHTSNNKCIQLMILNSSPHVLTIIMQLPRTIYACEFMKKIQLSKLVALTIPKMYPNSA